MLRPFKNACLSLSNFRFSSLSSLRILSFSCSSLRSENSFSRSCTCFSAPFISSERTSLDRCFSVIVSRLWKIFPACFSSNLNSWKSYRLLNFVGRYCFCASLTRLFMYLIYCASTYGFSIRLWSLRFPNLDETNGNMNFSIFRSSSV